MEETHTATATQDPISRSTTPRPRSSSIRIFTKRASYQSLVSPVLTNPPTNLPFSPVSPDWPAIKLISPSTASHQSIVSVPDEDDFKSPRLALLTSGMHDESREHSKLISPSVPVRLPGDELLYDVGNEEKPGMAFFNPDFQASLTRTKQEMKDVSLALWGCSASHKVGSDLYMLKQRAQQLGEFEPIRTRRIGLVGDSRAGRSSVINALLDQDGLDCSTQSSEDSGYVVTEYWLRPAHHNEPFAIEVHYMTADEIKDLIHELLRTFRAGHEPAIRDVDDFDERVKIRHRAEKAWRTLHVMFRNQQFFTKDFLLRYPTNTQTTLIDVLHHWAIDLQSTRPGGGKPRTWSAAAIDAEECSDKLDALTSNPVDHNTSALWPFIRLIRVYLRSPILHSGVVLVSCPSPSDLDYTRARTSERCLQSCHEIFVVASRQHALRDQCVFDIVARVGRYSPLSIICTKSDDISVRDIERRDPDVSLQVRTWRLQVETLRMQAKRSQAQRQHGVPGALQEEARSRDLLEEMEFGLKQFLVERRNAQVANRLIELYAAQVQMGDLKVFCVSSRDYWDHRYEERGRAMSRLDLSGIVDLRRYCHSVAANMQFEEAGAYMEHDVPAFLGSLKMWAAGSGDEINVEKAEEIRGVLKNVEGVAISKIMMPSSQLRTTKSTLNAQFASAIVIPMRERRSEWRNAALEASKEWTKWDAKDYAAFCRRYGNHETEATGHRNWNEELIQPMRAQLQNEWKTFQDMVEECEMELIQYIEGVFDEMCSTLRDHLPALPLSVHFLLSSLPHRKATIAHLIRIIFASLLEASTALSTDTLEGHLSSTINTLMAPAYHAACALLPSTSAAHFTSAPTLTPPHSPSPSLIDQQRKDMVTSHIASTRIFSRLSCVVEKAHRGIVREAFADLEEGVVRVIDELVRDARVVAAGLGKVDSANPMNIGGEFAIGLKGWAERAEAVVADLGVVVDEVRIAYTVVGGEDGGVVEDVEKVEEAA